MNFTLSDLFRASFLVYLHYSDDRIQCHEELGRHDFQLCLTVAPWDGLPVPLILCDRRIRIPNTAYVAFGILRSNLSGFRVSVSVSKEKKQFAFTYSLTLHCVSPCIDSENPEFLVQGFLSKIQVFLGWEKPIFDVSKGKKLFS